MKYYVFYLPSGEIDAVAAVPDEVDPTTLSSLPYLEVTYTVDSGKFWVNNGELTDYSELGQRRRRQWPGFGWTWNPATEQWVDERSAQRAWTDVRIKRNRLLLESDWTQGNDSPLDATARAAWATYRQGLRDITDQPDPHNIVWPTAPAGTS